MVFEEVIIKSGDSISKIANNYGYHLWDWQKVWEHPSNAALKRLRDKPEKIKVGDKLIIPLPWKMTSKSLTPFVQAHGEKTFSIKAKRDGVKGRNLKWVQTVFQNNQSIGATSTFYADACPDNDSTYNTSMKLASDPNRKNSFFDAPWRYPAKDDATAWYTILSLCSVTDYRVSIFESIVWGIDFGKSGLTTNYIPRLATPYEVSGHLKRLQIGKGISKSFRNGSWMFREAPRYY